MIETQNNLRHIAYALNRQADDLENGTDTLFDALQTANLHGITPLMHQIVNEWRHNGGTWREIGEAINTTRQSAQQRFAR